MFDLTPKWRHLLIASRSSSLLKFDAPARALKAEAPKYTASAPPAIAASSASGEPAGASSSF